MKSLIVGMGIGQLYKTVLTELGAKITTVDQDISKGADFPNILSAILARGPFDTVHICTPNFTHASLATQVAHDAKIVFIEKPGVATESHWSTLVNSFPETRFMMVKNNMWRDNIDELRELAEKAKIVNLNWINKDRVPSPGSWFTTKKLAFGGVSRDLMPHLLSLYIALEPSWRSDKAFGCTSIKQWELKDLTSTDYGTVNIDGTYDVDDKCRIQFGDKWNLTANWRSLEDDKRNIEFIMEDNTKVIFELGLCPEYAYRNMIDAAWLHKDDNMFWKGNFLHDCWIHEMMEKF